MPVRATNAGADEVSRFGVHLFTRNAITWNVAVIPIFGRKFCSGSLTFEEMAWCSATSAYGSKIEYLPSATAVGAQIRAGPKHIHSTAVTVVVFFFLEICYMKINCLEYVEGKHHLFLLETFV